MNILICVKRVPATGGRMTLTADEQEIDTRYLGFTVSPHEECAVEEAIRLIEAHGGSTTVLTLGPPEAAEQLRDAMAMGVERGILLESGGGEWDAGATAAAIVEAVRAQSAAGMDFDLLLFGNESADAGGYQVGVRVARALDLPCLTGVKALEIQGGTATARREAGGGWDVFEMPLPAVITVKEGINLPRYPSMPGRLKAKKKPIEQIKPTPPQSGFVSGMPQGNGAYRRPAGLEKVRLKLPPAQESRVEILGNGPEAAPRAVEVFRKLGVM